MNPNKCLRLAQEKADAADKTYDNAHYQQSVDLWLESAELSKNLKGNELHYAACLENTANALQELGDYSQAKKFIELVSSQIKSVGVKRKEV